MTKRRIEFPGGWWAEVRTAWTYQQDAAMAGAWAFVEDPEGFNRAVMTTLRESVVAARLPDVHGNEVAFSDAMWSEVDGRYGRKLFRTCRDDWGKWQEDSDPKDIDSRSSGSQPESQPRSPAE